MYFIKAHSKKNICMMKAKSIRFDILNDIEIHEQLKHY